MDNLPDLLSVDSFPENLNLRETERNISDAFEKVHVGFLEAVNVFATPVIQAGSGPSMDQSGTTATALLITRKAILIASLGDSRAVMSSQTNVIEMKEMWKNFPAMSAIQLTHDHVASDPTERDLVVARGGSVSTRPGGVTRVNGTLAVTRSIGDALLSPVLSRQPHVRVLSRHVFREHCGSDAPTASMIPCFVILGECTHCRSSPVLSCMFFSLFFFYCPKSLL
jgi:hypothetical protein